MLISQEEVDNQKMSSQKQSLYLITPCLSNNPGAILQAFAMAHFLNFQGYDVTLLTPFSSEWFRKQQKPSIKRLLFWLRGREDVWKISFHFESFCRRNLSLQYCGGHHFIPQTPFCVFGSDQIFSYSFNQKEEDRNFNFGFVFSSQNKIAYSVSFGNYYKSIPADYLQFLKRSISTFRFLSTRETEGQKIIAFVTDNRIRAPRTLDPTFFFNKQDWKEICQIDPGQRALHLPKIGKYILLFSTGSNDETIQMAKLLQKKKKLPVFVAFYYGKRLLFGWKERRDLTPFDLIRLIQNAAYVVTASYHGFILSLNFEKEVFYGLSKYENSSNSRFDDFIDQFHLKDHEITLALVSLPSPINYSKITPEINRLREASKTYLLSSLEAVIHENH